MDVKTPAIPCAICIKMVAETCQARSRCLHDDYRKGVLSRVPVLDWYADRTTKG